MLAAMRGHRRFVWLETTRPDGGDRCSLLFCEPRAWLRCRAGDDPDAFFAALDRQRAAGRYLAGWFAYEFGWLLEPFLARRLDVPPDTCVAEVGVFDAPYLFFHHENAFAGGRPWPRAADPGPAAYRITGCTPAEPQERYCEAIHAIHRYIAAVDTYQVNYPTRLRFRFTGRPEGLYCALRASQSVGYSACIRSGEQWILSLSPELFFRVTGDRRIVARPMKGTVRRGPMPAADAALAAWLRQDVKNRSENVMIVDLLRNDLGRIAEPGSVEVERLFAIETYETLHQMTSTVTASLGRGVSLADIFRALFPCGSVTGAPKIRTMEIIRELEVGPRGVYTGAIGYMAPDDSMVFSVPIRTVVLRDGQGEMGVGSGVVIDSSPEDEWRETLLKGRFLTEPPPVFRLIETMYWDAAGGYWLLPLHLERLAASAAFLGFFCDIAGVEQRLAGLAGELRRLADGTGRRVRLLLAKDGAIELEHQAWPSPPSRDAAAALAAAPAGRVRLAGIAVDPGDTLLYHKTTCRQRFDEAWRAARADGLVDCLFVNGRGELTEGAISNLFLRFGRRILTPPVEAGLLPGTFRRYLLEQAPLAGQGITVAEAVLRPDDLRRADRVYIGNSVRGLVPVEVVP